MRDPYVCYRRNCRYNQGPNCKDGSCRYIFVEGKSKLAQHEPGTFRPETCKCFAPGPRQRMERERPPMPEQKEVLLKIKPIRRASAQDWKEATKLYVEGLSDQQIGDRIGCSKDTIRMWRKRNGLPTKQKAGRRKEKR